MVKMNEQNYSNSSAISRKPGAILNIVISSILIVLILIAAFVLMSDSTGTDELIGTILASLLIISLFICTIVSNVKFMRGKDNKLMAGVLGLFFSGIIGGILVLVSN